MLGRLTRWLRILGCDVEYSDKLNDAALIAAAKRERRTLLTRDFELYRYATSREAEAFYVQASTGEGKLAEVAKRFNVELTVSMTMSRCPKCNSRVRPVSKGNVAGKVGESTFAHYEEFWKCRKCGQVYWQGAHWKGIMEKLEKTKKVLETMREESAEDKLPPKSQRTRSLEKRYGC
jgi:uncharacterized protein with PIN domain